MAEPEPDVTYPREVPVEPGMPPGWKAIEKQYGPGSKVAGKTYVRWQTLDGKIKNICSPRLAIEAHCKRTGEDVVAVLAEYTRVKEARQSVEAEKRKAQGNFDGEARDALISKFHKRFGELSGPQVFCFPGWITRWHFLQNCNQVAVEYIDPEGTSFKLLKQLECAFQFKIENGTGDHLPQMIEEAKLRADLAEFAKGSKTARENKAVFESSAEGVRVFDQEWRRTKMNKRKEESAQQRKKAKLDIDILRIFPEAFPQSGWAAPVANDEVGKAFEGFQKLLVERGFSENVNMVAVFGTSCKRKFHRRVAGIYYQLQDELGGKACYQRLLHFPDKQSKLGCDGVYLVYSLVRQRWELATKLSEYRPVIGHALELTGPWHLQDGQADYVEESGMTVVRREVNGT